MFVVRSKTLAVNRRGIAEWRRGGQRDFLDVPSPQPSPGGRGGSRGRHTACAGYFDQRSLVFRRMAALVVWASMSTGGATSSISPAEVAVARWKN